MGDSAFVADLSTLIAPARALRCGLAPRALAVRLASCPQYTLYLACSGGVDEDAPGEGGRGEMEGGGDGAGRTGRAGRGGAGRGMFGRLVNVELGAGAPRCLTKHVMVCKLHDCV